MSFVLYIIVENGIEVNPVKDQDVLERWSMILLIKKRGLTFYAPWLGAKQ